MGWGKPVSGVTFWGALVFFVLGGLAQEHGDMILELDSKQWWAGSNKRTRTYHHLEGDVRWRQLYSATKFFLRINSNGKVDGTQWKQCPDSIMEIRSVGVGIVAIRSIHSGFYLAMNRKGKIYGTKIYSLHCKFKEFMEENRYNTYASFHWQHRGRPMFLSLNGKGIPRRGFKTSRQHSSTHFLPLLIS